MTNLILDTDSYKMSHFLGYPLGTTEMYSYLESRGGRYDSTVFFGLQPILDRLAQGITPDDVKQARFFAEKHGVPFNEDGWNDIAYRLNGKLPVEILAVPEGTIVPTRNVLATIRNTDPKHAWLTSYLETMLLRVWYPTTVATRIYNMKQAIRPFFDRTSDNYDGLPFALLDFSSRGVSSLETSQIGGAAYLAHFLGSDNVPAVDYVNKNYDSEMSGFSVPATEHSIMCAYGGENEFSSFEQLVDRMGMEGGILSVVSDTWNIFRAVEMWVRLADKIKAKNLTLVVRPDSGEIRDVLPHVIKTISEGFGTTKNSKGFGVINNAKILWGDGINEDTVTEAFKIAEEMGISADSIITGSGGGLMQANIDRDTCKFAVKGSNVIVDGDSRGISKSPITDQGKESKRGKMSLLAGSGGQLYTSCVSDDVFGDKNILRPVFRNGEVLSRTSIDDVRKTIEEQ